MSGLSERAAQVNMLTQEQRDAAYESARLRIAGPQPTLETSAAGLSRHPRAALIIINSVGGLMLFAAFVPSAIRLYIAGSSATSVYLSDIAVQRVIGVMSVLLAESGQIGLTLWASTISGRLRYALYAGAILCTLFAFVGNYSVVMAQVSPAQADALLYFEIFLPPTLVLIAANVLKTQVLDAVETRHAINVRYQQALAAWRAARDAAERDPLWERTLANCLREALRETNRSNRPLLRDLTREDWIALVVRERTAEEWWDGQASGRRTDRLRPATLTLSDGRTADAQTSASGQTAPDSVARHLETYPDDDDLSIRQLAAKLGVTKHAVDRGRAIYRARRGLQ